MAKHRTSTRKKKKKPNSFVIFLLVVILLALVSFGISYFMLDNGAIAPEVIKTTPASQEESISETAKQKVTTKELDPIQGTWVSNYDGTMMTIQAGSFTLESPAVDNPEKIKGSIGINKTIITFVFSGKNTCGSVEGHYEYQLEAGGEIYFKKIKDPCSMRSELMSASWFKL